MSAGGDSIWHHQKYLWTRELLFHFLSLRLFRFSCDCVTVYVNVIMLCHQKIFACMPASAFSVFFAKKDKKEGDNDYVKAIAENREDLLVNGWYMWTTWEYFSSIAMILLWKMLSLFLKMVTMHGKIFHA